MQMDSNLFIAISGGFGQIARIGRFVGMFGLAWSGALSLQGCDGTTYPPYRYKETVVVETPQGIRTGSTVIEVRMYKEGQSNPFAHGAIHGEIKGEAAAVDLPNGRTLFALLTSPSNYGWAKGAYQMLVQPTPEELAQPYDPNNTPFDMQFRRAMALRGPQVLPAKLPSADPTRGPVSAYPWLVTFTDIKNPASITAVDPANFAATFGSGYKLKAIILQKTEDPVPDEIQKRLDTHFFEKWALRQKGELQNGFLENQYFDSLASKINKSQFTTDGEFH